MTMKETNTARTVPPPSNLPSLLLGTPRLVAQCFSFGSPGISPLCKQNGAGSAVLRSLLLGNPRLQPWASQPTCKERALAPGVCFLIHATVLFGLFLPSTATHAQLPAGTTDATQPQTQQQHRLLT